MKTGFVLGFLCGLATAVLLCAVDVAHESCHRPIVLPARPIDCPLILPAPPKDEAVEGTIVVVVPPEEVRREGLLMIAKEVVGDVTITLGDKTLTGKLVFPDTAVRRTGVGAMRVDSCTATGTVR